MLSPFNHRFATWGNEYSYTSKTALEDAFWTINTAHAVVGSDLTSVLQAKIRNWYVVYRVIGRATDERTLISCILRDVLSCIRRTYSKG